MQRRKMSEGLNESLGQDKKNQIFFFENSLINLIN